MEFNKTNVISWRGFMYMYFHLCWRLCKHKASPVLMSHNNCDQLQQVKRSDENHWAHVMYRPEGPRQRAVTKQLHAQLGAGQEVTSRPVICSSPSAKNFTVTPCGKTCFKSREGNWVESNWGVTALQTVLHRLPLISGGVKSEKCWEWLNSEDSPHTLDSGIGKTEQLCTPSWLNLQR